MSASSRFSKSDDSEWVKWPIRPSSNDSSGCSSARVFYRGPFSKRFRTALKSHGRSRSAAHRASSYCLVRARCARIMASCTTSCASNVFCRIPCAYPNSGVSNRSIIRSNAPGSRRCTATARFSSTYSAERAVSPPVQEFFIVVRTQGRSVSFAESSFSPTEEWGRRCRGATDGGCQRIEKSSLGRRSFLSPALFLPGVDDLHRLEHLAVGPGTRHDERVLVGAVHGDGLFHRLGLSGHR